MTRRVLVARRGALGDCICFLPILAAARATWPNAELHYAATAEVASLFAERGAADRALSIEDLNLWQLETARGRAACQRRLADYDWLVGDFVGLETGHACESAFDVRVDERSPKPASHQLLQRAAECWHGPFPQVSAVPSLPSATQVEPDSAWLHPGSGSARKNWPRFASIAAQLLDRGLRVSVSFGEADGSLRADLEPGLPDGVRIVTNDSLTDLAANLERAAVYVGNDSGVTHLAAALGVPTVTVFVCTRPEVWAAPATRVIEASVQPQEDERRVLEAVMAIYRSR